MAKETVCYRDTLERISERYPNKEALTLSEMCDLTGYGRKRVVSLAIKQNIGRKDGGRWTFLIVKIARWMAQ